MDILIALFLILIAGLINGSFALPTKYTTRWRFENIWLQYAIWAFVLFPWIAIFVLAPQVFHIYHAASWFTILVMVLGGFFFGAGQIGFAFAIDMIGIGLAFVICLGFGTGFGFLFPLLFQYPDQIFTLFGGITILGTLLAIAGLLISTYAGELRDREDKKILPIHASNPREKYYKIGVFLAVIAGLFSAGQNFSFSLTAPMQQVALQLGASRLGAAVIMWPGFLFFSFIPYAAYMVYLHIKNRSFVHYKLPKTKYYFVLALLMGACWFGSLMFYSKASQFIGKLGPIVGWPLFMVLVVLMSNFLGWRHREWDNCSRQTKFCMSIGIASLVLAVVVLGIGSAFR